MVWLINITVERNLIGANNMKKLLLLFFTLLIYSNTYADWTKVLPGNNASLYIDFDTLIEKDGFIYWWYLDSWGKGSEKTYAQGDCNLKGFRVVKRIRYSFPMGEGEGVDRNINGVWEYYQPNTGFEVLLNFICDMSRLNPEEKSVRIDSLVQRNEALERKSNLSTVQSNIEELSPELKALKSSYVEAIQGKIKNNWKYEEAKDNWFCNVLINQANNGAIEGVKILECSSNNDDFKLTRSQSQAFGSSIRRAIFRSSPLPLPSNETLFDKRLIIRITAN